MAVNIKHDMIGKSIGRYKVTQLLGEGGVAVVYKAYDRHLETDVALKIIRREWLDQDASGKLLQRFEAEAKRVARLSHPNIIPILDYGKHEDRPYLVMKYLPGGTLKDRLVAPVYWQEAARLLVPIARALSYAHQHGIVHLDVKPANILMTETGEPMLADFGIARLLREDEDDNPPGETTSVLGTPEYMAPEQATGGPVDHRADIYALGLIFYELLTGRMPFKADTPMGVLMKHIHEPAPPPRQFTPGLPEMVQRVVKRALEKDPDDRFPSMTAFREALGRLAQPAFQSTLPMADDEPTQLPVAPPAAAKPAPVVRKRPRRRALSQQFWSNFATGMVLLAIGSGLAMFDFRHELGAALASPTPTATQSPTLPVVIAQPPTRTPTPAPTATRPNFAATQAAAIRATQTAWAVDMASAATATAEAYQEQTAGMREMLSTLQARGLVENVAGRYVQLNGFEESWAQINWYQWWDTGEAPTDFLIRARTSWESASSTANWFNTGCGFVFREKDENNHYIIYLAMDGNVYLKGYVNSKYREFAEAYYAPIDRMKGEAEVALLVRGPQITYFINGKQVLRHSNSELKTGSLSYTLVSGTNKDFGTRCAMNNVELWALETP